LPDRISTNWIRHTFATIARNECGFDRDTVGKCLRHDDGRVTDAYIRPDFTIIDRVCRAVLDKIGIPDMVMWGGAPHKGHWITKK
jgi:hypothetical protein